MKSDAMIGQVVSLYCPALTIGPYAKIRIRDINALQKEKKYHEDRWLRRALRAKIIETSGNLVAAVDSLKANQTVFIVDLSTCEVVTAFKKGRAVDKFLSFDRPLVL